MNGRKRRRSPAGGGEIGEVYNGHGLHPGRDVKNGLNGLGNGRHRLWRVHLPFGKQAKDTAMRRRPVLMERLVDFSVRCQQLAYYEPSGKHDRQNARKGNESVGFETCQARSQ